MKKHDSTEQSLLLLYFDLKFVLALTVSWPSTDPVAKSVKRYAKPVKKYAMKCSNNVLKGANKHNK